jgi:hypothetical protein
MSVHSLHSVPFHNQFSLSKHTFAPPCALCNQPVPLEDSKTDEHGLAIHEVCYLLKLGFQRPVNDGVHRIGSVPSSVAWRQKNDF